RKHSQRTVRPSTSLGRRWYIGNPGAGLALQGRDNLAGGIALRTLFRCFRYHCNDVAGAAILFSARNDDANRALVRCLLQLGKRAGLAPSETRSEIPQPAKPIVGALFVDGLVDAGLDRFAFCQTLNGARRPPNSRQINAREVAIVVRINIAESEPIVRLIAFEQAVVDRQVVDDCCEFRAPVLSPCDQAYRARLANARRRAACAW